MYLKKLCSNRKFVVYLLPFLIGSIDARTRMPGANFGLIKPEVVSNCDWDPFKTPGHGSMKMFLKFKILYKGSGLSWMLQA